MTNKYQQSICQVASLPLPWEKLSGCNILVTGATGLIGSCLVDVLMAREKRDYDVFASGRNKERAFELFSDYLNDDHFHFIQHDVTKPLLGDTRYDIIIHAASNASPNFFSKNPVEVMKANFDGVAHLLDYGRDHNLRRMLYISSGEVYGQSDGSVFDETYSGYVDILSPRSCYPSAKRATETLCMSYAEEYGIDVVIARPAHTYGPKFTEKDNRVYAQFISNVLHGEDIVMKSTGEQMRSWCYVVDCASALLHILLKGENMNAYNIADNSSNVTIRELAEMIASIGKKNVVIDVPTDAERKAFNPVKQSLFSTERLESLGWNVSGTMLEKMQSTIEWQTLRKIH